MTAGRRSWRWKAVFLAKWTERVLWLLFRSSHTALPGLLCAKDLLEEKSDKISIGCFDRFYMLMYILFYLIKAGSDDGNAVQ